MFVTDLEGKLRVFDGRRGILIDSDYMTQAEYWEAQEKEWRLKQRVRAEQSPSAEAAKRQD